MLKKYNDEYSFKLENDEDSRKIISEKMIQSFPNHIPIIFQAVSKGAKSSKILINDTMRVYHLMIKIRLSMKLTNTESVFLFIDNKILLQSDWILSNVYSKYKESDGFLYIKCSLHDAFGK